MIGTINCVYETPCGWCSKWDKKCDKKMHSESYRINNPKSNESGFFIAFNNLISVLGVSFPFVPTKALDRDGKTNPKQTILLFSSNITSTNSVLTISLKLLIKFLRIFFVIGTVPYI